ncbi:MAG: GGDEF domain-containing protein [Burkholderiaceae bacterium]|nr:GGDEF domain-containing protein [Burkholderiaceae bacterium]
MSSAAAGGGREPAWPPTAAALSGSVAALPLLDAHLGACRRRARSAALLHLAVGGLPAQGGEALLTALGRRLRARVRATDEVLALEGHCFAVLLLDADERAAALVRDRLLRLLAEDYRIGTELLRPQLRIGHALAGRDGQRAAELLQTAAGRG